MKCDRAALENARLVRLHSHDRSTLACALGMFFFDDR